jgi:outer membrane lipase/esterase
VEGPRCEDTRLATGLPSSAFAWPARKPSSLTTVLEASAAYAIGTPWAVLQPTMLAEWAHEYLDNSRLISGTLIADPVQTVFGVPTNNPDRNYFNLGAGLTATFARGISAFFFYETVLGRDNFTAHSFTAGARFEF